MKSKVVQLLERYGYEQGDAEPSNFGVRYWRSERYSLPVSIVNGIWEACDGEKVQRGCSGDRALQRLEAAILRTQK
jgi:hypothetical protein